MTPGLIGFSKVASGQLRVNGGHACWPDDFKSDDASVLALLIASCDFMTQDQRPTVGKILRRELRDLA